jgi:hypothetical protein
MASVSQLGYLGIGVSDAKAWHDLAGQVLGNLSYALAPGLA